ncbi:MAG TPA: hypothetical protein VFY45_23280 [Baekduia sp.]|nr:hypothetical protein [Baekduia sp.]
MTDDTNLDLLRRLDPLDMSTTAELDPDGTTAHRVRTAAIAAAQQPGLTVHSPTGPRRSRRAPRLALGAIAVAALAAVAPAVGLPGWGSDGSPTAPADARAALLTAAERTAGFTSGHIVWKMAYNKADPPMDFDLTNEVRFEGSDVDVTGTSNFHHPAEATDSSTYGFRAVGGQSYWRYGDGPYERKEEPGTAAGAPAGVLTRVQAADALVAATRSAADVQEAEVDGGTQFTATVATADVPDLFRPPFKRTVDNVAITAIVGDDGAVRSLALRAPGEAVDVTFSELGEPQGIVTP